MSSTHPNTSPDTAQLPPEATDALAHHHLASAEETLRQIAHGIAHDLQSSLRHVASYAGLLAEQVNAGDVQDAPRLAQKVLGASRQMQTLLDAVRSLAQLQRSYLQHTVVDSAALVHGLREELLLIHASADGPTPLWQVDPFLPTVYADALLLRQVWRHLLHNALRFSRTAEDPRISVGWQPVPKGMAFFVHDNGCGFEQEHAARLFSLFQRLQPGAGQEPGNGLGAGLALVRRIVDCHGGRVWASARPGQGATFGFSLPQVARA